MNTSSNKEKYTPRDLENYNKYLSGWEKDRLCSGVVDWSNSNNFGDPFSMKEWKERKHLRF